MIDQIQKIIKELHKVKHTDKKVIHKSDTTLVLIIDNEIVRIKKDKCKKRRLVLIK